MLAMVRKFGLLLVFGLAALPGSAEKVPTLPAPTGYVDDYANVLADDSRAQLESLCVELHNKTRAQLFLVTIHTLNGISKEEFANQLFHNWKIGEKKTDRGVLILLAVDDRKYRIEVGYGLEGILNDAKVGDIGREMVPALKGENYAGAARTGLERIAAIVAEDAHVSLASLEPGADEALLDRQPLPPPEPPSQPSNTPILLFIFGFIGLVCVGIGLAIRRQLRHGGGGYAGGSGFLDSGSDSTSSFSSSDSSSSSDSFSGGDGGDSGGGGAGGDW